jgi:hypothetical protein
VTPSRWLAALLGVAIVANIVIGMRGEAWSKESRAWQDSTLLARADLVESRAAFDSVALAFAMQDAVADTTLRRYRASLTRIGGLGRLLDSLRSIGAKVETTTVRVPVEVIVTADAALAACTETRDTCRTMREKAETERDDAKRLRTADSARVVLLENAPAPEFWALGVAYDGRLGVTADRDWNRLRAGLSVKPKVDSTRVEMRLSWRFRLP